jgi:hypothetical protein
MEENAYSKDERVAGIIRLEWAMFQAINQGKVRAACQDDFETFLVMRYAQFDVWPPEALTPYLDSLVQAANSGQNTVALKYIYMMESTDPDGYRDFQSTLPDLADENRTVIGEIMGQLMPQTKALAAQYPRIFHNSRPIETVGEDSWPSIETYQRCELMTYPLETLHALKAAIEADAAFGKPYPEQVLENTVRCYGFDSLDAAEAAQTAQGAVQE